MGGVFYLQECKNPHTNPSLRTSSQKWSIPGLSWVASKVCQTTRPQVFPGNDSVCGRCSGAAKNAAENEQLEDVCFPNQDGSGQLSESKATTWRICHQRGESSHVGKYQLRTALSTGSGPDRDPVHNLQIQVSGQRGCLGISIAGGKGSLPFKNHDEGIFVSRVIEGGASEKAGIHVGDRLLEVNGLNMQGATHQEAVSALRKASGCIKLRVLREGPLPPGAYDLEGLQDQWDAPKRQLSSQNGRGQAGKQSVVETAEDCLSRKTEPVVSNGNSIDLGSKLEAEDNSLQGRKQSMAIPRIILTHPSTSDEDVELLTQSPSREPQRDFHIHDRHATMTTG